jgi:hypothetical protein
VTETVETVKEAVQETVETVKGSVQETVETVKETFDLKRQVDRHPWLMFGGSVALGYVGGYALNRVRASGTSAVPYRAAAWSTPRPNGGPYSSARPEAPVMGEAVVAPPAREPEPGLFSSLADALAPELGKLKGLAIGALFGVMRDAITRSVPEQMGPQLAEVMDNITVKLGGRPFSGPILDSFSSERSQAGGKEPTYSGLANRGEPLGQL